MAGANPVRPLRPHHLLCIAHFVGKGYSSDFAENMRKVVKELAANPAQQVELCSSADDICRCCPNRREEECLSAEQVKRYDESCLRLLSLQEGECLSWGTLSERVRERILRPGKREDICKDCQWNALCEQVQKEGDVV